MCAVPFPCGHFDKGRTTKNTQCSRLIGLLLVLISVCPPVFILLLIAASEMNKRFQQALSLQKKQEIISSVNDGIFSKTEIAKKFGVAKSTVTAIMKNRQKVECAYATSQFEPSRKRMRTAKNEDIEVALLRWIRQARSENMTLTGAILQEKALFFAYALGVADFQCSSGWLHRFKERRGIICKKICGEEAAVSSEIVENFVGGKLLDIMQRYAPSDIYNADETGLFWRALPNRTLSIKGEKCSGGKSSKERITAMVACNMDGSDKLPLLVIGKSRQPRCFKGIKTLPVPYDSTKKAWMTAEIFTNWLKRLDKQFVRQKRNICLLLDNCSAHCDIVGLKSIELAFFPPNTTAKLQPCDQGIIKCLKQHYRKQIVCKAIQSFENKLTFQITLLETLSMLRNAWRSVSPSTIRNCFRHAGFPFESLEDVTEEINLSDEIVEQGKKFGLLSNFSDFEDFVTFDDEVAITETITDDIIASDIVNKNRLEDEIDSDEEEEENSGSCTPVSNSNARNALHTIRQFIMEQNDSSEYLEYVDRLFEFSEQCSEKKKKQKLITEFWKNS